MEKFQILIRSTFPVQFAEITISEEIKQVKCDGKNIFFEIDFIESNPEKNFYQQAPMSLVLTSRHTLRSTKIVSVLNKISDGFQPPEGEVAATADQLTEKDGAAYSINFYPEEFRHFIKPISDEHIGLIKKLHTLLSWRCGNTRNFSFVDRLERLYCSINGNEWFQLPPHYQLSGSMLPRPPVLNQCFDGPDDISDYLISDKISTIPIELLHEARKINSTGNSRSALVIAMSALEVRIKEFIASISPNSKWLIENIQSPPIIKLLKDYLPSLVSSPDVYKSKIDPYIDEIDNAVTLRNTITHKGANVSFRRCAEFIENIEYLMLVLDAESGQKWPLSLLSQKEQNKNSEGNGLN